jgi:nicotinamide mononucleotide transporter
MSVSELVAPLNVVLFHIGRDAVTWAELLGFATGAVGVWLTVRANIWNFPIGLANNLFFLVLFWAARLYADAALQIVYLGFGAFGWWEWLHGGARWSRRVMARARPWALLSLAGLAVPVTWILTIVLTRANDIAPFWDALTTALSLAAQWLLNLKLFENWFSWMTADVVYVPLYFVKALYLTAIVYVIFLGLCVAGIRAWRRELLELRESRPSMVAA